MILKNVPFQGFQWFLCFKIYVSLRVNEYVKVISKIQSYYFIFTIKLAKLINININLNQFSAFAKFYLSIEQKPNKKKKRYLYRLSVKQ